MDKTIHWGIIGCGDVTEIKSGPAFNKVGHSRLHAVMRRDAVKAADYAARHGVPVWYSDADDLINDPVVDAVYIATPPKYHEEFAIAALERGKNVYVEKPVTIDVRGAGNIAKCVENSGGMLSVAHYRRALPMFLKLKSLITENVLGSVKLIELKMFHPYDPGMISNTGSAWRVVPSISGGGLFYDLAPHQLDIITYIFGKPVSFGGISSSQSGLYEAEDAVTGWMLLENRIIFQGTWNFNMPNSSREDRCRITGERGVIEFAFFGNSIRTVIDGIECLLEFEHPKHIQQNMIGRVVDYFLGRGTNPCSINDAMTSLEVMEKFVHGSRK
jgi:predicted dehydrogenase